MSNGVGSRTRLAAVALALLLGASLSGHAQDKPGQILITNIHVFDGVNEARIENASILVEGNLIKAVSSDPIKAPDATVIDGGGRTLMPGLIDSHSHLNMTARGGVTSMEGMRWDEIGARAAAQAQDWLADGFTTVRDMGGLANGLKRTIDA
jgi:imidazolonepropionase-like amidohydrolase